MHINIINHKFSYNSLLRSAAAALFFLLLFAVPVSAIAAPSYSELDKEYKALLADAKKSMLREPWEKMQDKFDAFVKANPKSKDVSKAAYMGAKCMDEIAMRTHSARDFTRAGSLYGNVASKYPKSVEAGDALYRKAEIEVKHLKDGPAAQKTLAELRKNTKDEGLKKKAKSLESTIKNLDSSSGSGSAGTTSSQVQEPRPGSVDSSDAEPTLLSILLNAGDKHATAELELSTGAAFAWRFIPLAKTSTGKAALIIEVEGVVPKQGISGMATVPKGPVSYVLTQEATVPADGGKTIPSCRVELALSGDCSFSISSEKSKNKIVIKIDSSKQQSGATSGRGAAGKVESRISGQSSEQSAGTGSSGSGSRSNVAEQLGLTVDTILLDPGHGGKDSGACANGVTESKLVLKLSKLVETKLKKKGFNVSYTRDKDVFISLEKRTETANRRKVDLFVSIHVNANTDSSVAGIETYYLDQAKTKSAERVAARENGVSVQAISDLQVILSDLTLNTKMKESRELAKDVHDSMISHIKSGGYKARTNGVRSAPFYVLMGAKMPSILVEVGYCSNKADATLLKEDKYLERLADGIVDGVVSYKRRLERSVQ